MTAVSAAANSLNLFHLLGGSTTTGLNAETGNASASITKTRTWSADGASRSISVFRATSEALAQARLLIVALPDAPQWQSLLNLWTGAGDDAVAVDATYAGVIDVGAGNDVLSGKTFDVGAIRAGDGHDSIAMETYEIGSVDAGAGDDVMVVLAGTASGISAGRGDDTIAVQAREASLAFAAGDGNDTVSFKQWGRYAIGLWADLAASTDDIAVTRLDDGQIRLDFAGGDSITLSGTERVESVDLVLADGSSAQIAANELVRTADLRLEARALRVGLEVCPGREAGQSGTNSLPARSAVAVRTATATMIAVASSSTTIASSALPGAATRSA